MAKSRIFICSSSEGLGEARALQVLFDRQFETEIWDQGIFSLSQVTFHALLEAVETFDFAVLVLTPDDMVDSRGQSSHAPRDNVVFELGLFLGGLGRTRTFIVTDREKPIKLPSDLNGVTLASFERHSSGNLVASLGACATLITNQALVAGSRKIVSASAPMAVEKPLSDDKSPKRLAPYQQLVEANSPSRPGEERTRYCRFCGCDTIQAHTSSWEIFYVDRWWACQSCGKRVNKIG